MKKRFVLIGAALLMALLPVAAFSQSTGVQKGYFNPGTLSLRAGVGLDLYGYGIGVGLYPGIELTLARPVFGGVLPISFGLSGRGLIGFDSYYAGSSLELAAGAFGTAHLSWRDLGLNIPVLNPLDWYVGIGAVFGISGGYYGSLGYFPIWFSSYSGFNWFLNENFALTLEYSYLGWYSTTNIGILLKF